MPKLRLPPLPPSTQWSDFIPRARVGKGTTTKSVPQGAGTRELARRFVLASKPLADRFVRELGVRKDEVIIEAYSSMGQTTRSFLAGGYDYTTAADWQQVAREQEIVGPREGHVKRLNSGQFTFPPWDVENAQENKLPKPKDESKVVLPKAVIACEPIVAQLSRGLGFDPDQAPYSRWDYNKAKNAEELARLEEMKGTVPVRQSLTEERLFMSPVSLYDWEILPNILDNPIVWDKLPVYDSSKEGVESRKRPWTAPPPPMTLAVTIPDTVLGDQLMSQWVSSVIGSETAERSWLWAFGRVRIAGLVTKSLYDVSACTLNCLANNQRMMASPGETIHCKLSVMTNALFHIRPLPPYHHVPDVDKQGTRTETDYEAALEAARNRTKRESIPAPPPVHEITHTTAQDFWPHVGRLAGRSTNVKINSATVLPRPPLLGIELIPREKPWIKISERDEWEFILRHCFVREARPLAEAFPTVAFGAENLLPKFSEPVETSRYAGIPVDPNTKVRDIGVEQWARIVDIFAKWPFKPDVSATTNVRITNAN